MPFTTKRDNTLRKCVYGYSYTSAAQTNSLPILPQHIVILDIVSDAIDWLSHLPFPVCQ